MLFLCALDVNFGTISCQNLHMVYIVYFTLIAPRCQYEKAKLRVLLRESTQQQQITSASTLYMEIMRCDLDDIGFAASLSKLFNRYWQ